MRALEVLSREQRYRGPPVGDREQRHLRSVEVLLDDYPLARSSVRQRDREVVGDHDTLARGQRVILDHERRTERLKRVLGLGLGRGDPGLGGWNAGRRHDFLGEGFGPLDPGGGGIGTEGRDPGRPQRVGDAGH